MANNNFLNDKANALETRMAENFSFKILCKALLKNTVKWICRLIRYPYNDTTIVRYNNLVVFTKPYLDGGGSTFGQDYLRFLLWFGLKRCDHLYEFCAGTGYIGFSLLANGFCEKLTISDFNADAVRLAQDTVAYNEIQNVVQVYQSDCLDQIPPSEKWDMVVGNPPHYLPKSKEQLPGDPSELLKLSNSELQKKAYHIRSVDTNWSLHKRFYESVKKYMKPNGVVILQESSKGSDASLFKPMIESGGGKFIDAIPSGIRGKYSSIYYVVSQW